MSHHVIPSMLSRLSFAVFFLIAAPWALTAEDSPTPKAEPQTAEQQKPAEVKKPPEQKADPLADFEKQLQRELEGSPDLPRTAADQPSVIWQFFRTLLTLAFLLGIFYAIFRLYKFKRDLPTQNLTAVSSIYEFPLGTNQKLQIVELAGRIMVLGVTENSIQLISEITDKYTIDRIKLDCAEDQQQPRADFLTELSRSIKTNLTDRFGKGKPTSFAAPDLSDTGDQLESQRQSSMERLRKLKSDKFDWREK
jgi:flagellar protein FliO/FliZ